MKKFIAVAAAALLAAGAAQAAYKDGTYTGEGQGRASKIEVQVDIKGGKIADVKVLKHGETDMIFGAAQEEMLPKIVAKNGLDGVDNAAGATLSSEGIRAAVKAALAKAQ
ncbi:MAG: FMN-binding protein [Sutterella sp.]|nr:FMN-binding protein [Sutterella sp.]